jgi:hypothetical protein
MRLGFRPARCRVVLDDVGRSERGLHRAVLVDGRGDDELEAECLQRAQCPLGNRRVRLDESFVNDDGTVFGDAVQAA